MMTSLLFALLLALQGQVTITRMPGEAAPQRDPDFVDPAVEVEPDVLARGQTLRIVVKGKDAEALKTVAIDPPDGLRLGPITPLAPQPDGTSTVAVDVTVAPNAEAGERALVVTIAPNLSVSSATRPGGGGQPPDEISRQMAALLEKVRKEQSHPMEVGSIYINSHDIAVMGVRIDKPNTVRILVSDDAGDFKEPAAPARATDAGITLLSSGSDVLLSEAQCGNEVMVDVLDEPKVRDRQGSSAVLVAELSMMVLEDKGGCELRVRVRDAAGNTSRWFKTKIGAR